MDGASPPIPLERLLAHRAWIRRMARVLVRDENEADDLEQGVWLEALERPPRGERSLRGWFASALRHDVADRRRAETGRARREAANARPESVSSSADLVSRADAHRRVVVAVMDLAEPYRSTVLWRFFEDVPPSEIAAREGVPVETVRTRLRRALALLRERLDAQSRGGREEWRLALLPLLRAARPAVIGTAGSALTGGLVMPTLTNVALGLGLVVAGAISCTVFSPQGPPAPVAQETPPAAPPAIVAASATLTGIVLDERGAPMGGAGVRAGATVDGKYVSQRAKADGSGRFRVEGLIPGEWTVSVQTSAFAADLAKTALTSGERDLTLRLPAGGVAGRVFVKTSGAPLAGSAVQLSLYELVQGAAGSWSLGSTAGMAFADQDGNFRFRGISPGRHRLFAYPRDKSMRTFESDVDVGAAAIEGVQAGLDAARNGTVRLDVKDLDGRPVEGATLTIVTDQGGGRTTGTTLHATSGEPGVYVALVESGRRTITAWRQDLRAGSVTLEVEEGKTAQAGLVLQWPAGNTKGSLEVAGTLFVKGTKKPLSATDVSLAIYTVSPWGFAGIATAGADGRFRFKSLPPGTYRVVANPVKPVLRQAQADVTLTAGANKEGLDIALEECVSGKARFTVTDADGRPVDGLTFATVIDEGGGRSMSTGFAADRSGPGVYVAELETGSHEVMVWRDGFQPFSATVVVAKDGTVDVKVALKPMR